MNPFVEHHRQSIRLQYSCFDRMLLNAVVQPMQRPALIVGFLDKCKHVPLITKAYFRQVSEDYHRFVARLAVTERRQIVEPPTQRHPAGGLGRALLSALRYRGHPQKP